jgi:hypothetical protein
MVEADLDGLLEPEAADDMALPLLSPRPRAAWLLGRCCWSRRGFIEEWTWGLGIWGSGKMKREREGAAHLINHKQARDLLRAQPPFRRERDALLHKQARDLLRAQPPFQRERERSSSSRVPAACVSSTSKIWVAASLHLLFLLQDPVALCPPHRCTCSARSPLPRC